MLEAIFGLVEAELTCVEDGAQAVESFKTSEFDVILMDLQMPVMDGYTAIREIRRFEAATGRSRTPVLVISANVMANDIRASREAGADLHMGKPIVPVVLLERVADAVAMVSAASDETPVTHALG